MQKTNQTNPMTMTGVTSWSYANSTNIGQFDYHQKFQDLANSPVDLIIFGNNGDNGTYTIPRDKFDPNHKKLIFEVVDLTHATYVEPELYASATLPAWFGPAANGFGTDSKANTVQFWNPAWKQALLKAVQAVIADGYDGVFLDSCDGYLDWAQGNSYGNPTYPDALQAESTLIVDVKQYVQSLNLNRPFYIIGNNPNGIAAKYPSVLKNLDGIMDEWVFHQSIDQNNGLARSQFDENFWAPIYKSLNIPILGNDYPNPLNLSDVFQSFEHYSSLGWLPSVANSTGGSAMMRQITTGPFMYMATTTNPNILGSNDVVNFLSGGLVDGVTLIGGNSQNYFIGGPGRNTILGGAGDDIIYAHPASAGLNNILELQFISGSIDPAEHPSVQIKINGTIVLPYTPITENYNNPGSQNQVFSIDTRKIENISTLEIDAIDTFFIQSIKFDGVPINFDDGIFSQYSQSLGDSAILHNNGTATFSSSSFKITSPFLSDTSDIIDGGAGINTAVFRSKAADYNINVRSDSSLLLTALATAEGPDTLKNIQHLQFTDGSLIRETAAQVGSEIDALQNMANAGKLLGIYLTDSAFPNLTVSAEQALNDATALAMISNPFNLYVGVKGGHGVSGMNNHATIAVFDGAANKYALSSTSATSLVANSDTGPVILNHVLQAQFADKTLTFATKDSMDQALALLYQAAFNRSPDPGGLAFWESVAKLIPTNVQFDFGLADLAIGGGPSIAAQFVASAEFVAKYGSLNNAQYVTQLYANVLDRVPDTAGLDYWTSLLGAGSATRSDVLVGFAESAEAISNATHGYIGQSGPHNSWLYLL